MTKRELEAAVTWHAEQRPVAQRSEKSHSDASNPLRCKVKIIAYQPFVKELQKPAMSATYAERFEVVCFCTLPRELKKNMNSLNNRKIWHTFLITSR